MIVTKDKKEKMLVQVSFIIFIVVTVVISFSIGRSTVNNKEQYVDKYGYTNSNDTDVYEPLYSSN